VWVRRSKSSWDVNAVQDCLTLKMEALCSFKVQVNIQQSTRRHIPKKLNLHQHRCEDFKSRLVQNPLQTYLVVSTDYISSDPLPYVTALEGHWICISMSTDAIHSRSYGRTIHCDRHTAWVSATSFAKGPATQNAVCRSGLRSLSAAKCYILSRLF